MEDKIQEAFEKAIFNTDDMQKAIQAGIKSANLLPTEKVCPACGGSGTKLYYNLDTDEHTKGVCNVARCL